MEEKDFRDLLDELLSYDQETEWIEFKKNNSSPEEIGEYVSALSNSACLSKRNQGYLIYGIENESLNAVGTKVSFKNMKKGGQEINHWLAMNLDPKTDFKIIEKIIDDKRIVIIEIDCANARPIRFKGVAYVRIGSSKDRLDKHPQKEKKLWDIINHKNFEDEIAIEKIDENKVIELLDYPAYFNLMKLELPTNRDAILDRLRQEGMIVKKGAKYSITNLGGILFARDLSNFPNLARKNIRIIIYDGNSKLKTIKEESSNKGYAIAYQELVKFIMDQLPTNEIIEDSLRKKVEMFPEIAIRELLANTIIHQDFSEKGTNPMVEIYSDRIEFINAGKPLINPSRFIDYPPKSRNEKLADFMRMINVCERRGSGFDKIINSVEVFQLPAPEIIAEEDFVDVILYAHRQFKDMTKEDRMRACYQHCVLKYVFKEDMTNETLRNRFNIDKKNYPMVSKVIRDAIDAKAIKKDEGAKRYIPIWA
jgi:ATP-dependent DNA helicase RecG